MCRGHDRSALAFEARAKQASIHRDLDAVHSEGIQIRYAIDMVVQSEVNAVAAGRQAIFEGVQIGGVQGHCR